MEEQELLDKSHPGPTFPKLGVPDDRKETPIISTNRQQEIGDRAISNSLVGHLESPNRRKIETANALKELHEGPPSHGMTGSIDPRSGGQNSPSYSLSTSLIPPESGTTLNPNYPISTKLHEDFHQIMNRIEAKHGQYNRGALARKLISTLPLELQNAVKHNAEILIGGPTRDYEEMIAHALSYVNSGTAREQYLIRAKETGVLPENLITDDQMKRAVRHFQQFGRNIDYYGLTGMLPQVNKSDLDKSQPTPTFPKLGLPDNRRETPIVNTQQQHELHSRAVLGSVVRNVPSAKKLSPERLTGLTNKLHSETMAAGSTQGETGLPYKGATTAPSYALGENLLPRRYRGKPDAAVSTKLHEDFHQMMNRIQVRYGKDARNSVAHRLVTSLPQDLLNAINRYATVTTQEAQIPEELIAHTITYVNSEARRKAYHAIEDTLETPYEQRADDLKMKMALRHFRNKAATIAPKHIGIKKSESLDFNKMALVDIRHGGQLPPPSKPVGLGYENDRYWDYSHLLSLDHLNQGYKLHVIDSPTHGTMRSVLTHPSAEKRNWRPGEVGYIHAELGPDKVLNIRETEVQEEHRGNKGVPLYEALMAHAKNHLNATSIASTSHSSMASSVHRKLSEKHGFDYKPIIEKPKMKPGPFDARYGNYNYVLKSENFEELAKSLDVKKIDRVIEKVKSHLTDDLRQPQYRGKENCLAGHCYVASEAVYHMLDGQRAGWVPQSVQHEGGPHWYLKHKFSGYIIDPTASQFDTPVPYDKGVGRGFLTRQPSKRAQVVLDRISGTNLSKMEESKWIDSIKEVCAIAIFNSDGHLLMGQRNDDKKWNCPGGKMEPGESPKKAALREALEETGIELKSVKFLGDGKGGKDGHITVHCFEAHSDEAPNSENDPDKEVDNWEWVDVRGGLPEEFNEHTLHNGNSDVLLHILGLQSGKVETSSELSKSWKNAFVGAMAAAGLSAAPAHAAEPPGAKSQWTSAGLHEDLHPIAQLESSGGKNIKHSPHSKGELHTAVGAVGLKPITALEEYKKSSWLQKVFPDMLDPQKFVAGMNDNPAFYNGLASAHWQRLKKFFGGDRNKTAYAWRWGIGAAQRDAPAVQAADPYVTAYQKLWDKKNGGKIAQALTNPLSSSIAGVTPQSQNRIEKSEDLEKASRYWVTPGDIKIPHHNSPERAIWNENYKQKLVEVFGNGDPSRLRPVKIPISENIAGHWVGAGGKGRAGDRQPMYGRMVRAGDPMPPLVVKKTPNGWHVVDGNGRLKQMLEGGRTHADALELVSDEVKTKPISVKPPKHAKIYDLNDDTHGLMNPKVTQTKYGQIFEPVEMKDVFKKIKKMGYHGYTGHTNNPDDHVMFSK